MVTSRQVDHLHGVIAELVSPRLRLLRGTVGDVRSGDAVEVGPELSSRYCCEVAHGQEVGSARAPPPISITGVSRDRQRWVMEVRAEAWESLDGALATGQWHDDPPSVRNRICSR